MKAEDFKQPGERAKRLLRVAQALTVLSKSKAPTLSQVNNAITRLKGRQPAVAMALLFEYAKRRPLHKRIEWLNATQDALKEYQLSEDADKEAANQVSKYLEQQVEICEAEIEKKEKISERISMVYLGIGVILILSLLGYIVYNLTQKNDSGDKKTETPIIEKSSNVENSASEKAVSKEIANETKSGKDKPVQKHQRNGK
jgi:hypothetical protein